LMGRGEKKGGKGAIAAHTLRRGQKKERGVGPSPPSHRKELRKRRKVLSQINFLIPKIQKGFGSSHERSGEANPKCSEKKETRPIPTEQGG